MVQETNPGILIRMTAKQRSEFIKKLDFTVPCPKCGYHIPPSEMIRVEFTYSLYKVWETIKKTPIKEMYEWQE